MKTKSYLLAAASATMLLAGCTQNEVVDMPDSRAIGFGTYVGNTSRAGETTDPGTTEDPKTTETLVPEPVTDTDLAFLQDANKGNGFYVFGMYQDAGRGLITVFDGMSEGSHVKPLSKAGGGVTWGYQPINYWLADKTYRFAAYGPAAAYGNGLPEYIYNSEIAKVAVENVIKIVGFEAKGGTTTKDGNTIDNRVDLVVAEGAKEGYTMHTINMETGETETMHPVSFKFFHALSKVRFSFVNGWRNDVTLTISDVSVGMLNSKGDLSTNGTLALATGNILGDIMGGSTGTEGPWTNITAPKTYDWTKEFKSDVFEQEGVYENYFIPQQLGSDVVLKFKVSVSNLSGGGPDLGSGSNVTTLTVKIPDTEWKAGYFYHYKLYVDGELFGLRPIQFDNIDVATWPVEGHTDVNIGENKEDVTAE